VIGGPVQPARLAARPEGGIESVGPEEDVVAVIGRLDEAVSAGIVVPLDYTVHGDVLPIASHHLTITFRLLVSTSKPDAEKTCGQRRDHYDP
jgi:hypothetical protein